MVVRVSTVGASLKSPRGVVAYQMKTARPMMAHPMMQVTPRSLSRGHMAEVDMWEK